MSTQRKLFSGIFVAALLAAVVFVVFQANRGSRADPQKSAPAVPVTTAQVMLKTVPVRLYAIGNVEPYTTVAVKARVDGQLVSVRFKEGDEVRQGAVLFEIDPRPFAASLKQAQANLLKDRALLDRAREQDKRYKDLLTKNFISTDAYEQVRTNAETADATTGTIKLKAEFPNGDKALWPGQYVNVVLTLHEQKDAIVTPSSSVQSGPTGQYVFVVKPDSTVELRNITIARAEGDDTVVASGLQAGDQVVIVGQLRLAPGTRVNVGKAQVPS